MLGLKLIRVSKRGHRAQRVYDYLHFAYFVYILFQATHMVLIHSINHKSPVDLILTLTL